ncbi:MAG: type II secretion system protein GspI [Coxiella sp. RIFCSPHIGHO2_12_FULL_42_15]|nr:MAG: type II secretion system protein GspI [Coxiella sp. RIFCSPHIGHO2_12_FULL_42_15]
MKRGFTLIEVLVALAIIAIALVAVVKIAGQSVRHTFKVKEKIAAHWVAMNVISEVQCGLIKTDQVNSRDGTMPMLGSLWRWHASLLKNAAGEISKIHVSVKPEHQDHVVESLTGAM